MTLIRFVCQHCQTKVKATDQFAGTVHPCPKCQKPISIPSQELTPIQLDESPTTSPVNDYRGNSFQATEGYRYCSQVSDDLYLAELAELNRTVGNGYDFGP